jgi:hypothetical protein
MQRFGTALGLALLYASAYYLPFLNPYFLYFIPSFYDFLVLPSLLSVLVLTPVFFLCSSPALAPRSRRVLAFCGATILTLIAVKCVFDASGYPWVKLLTLLSSGATGITFFNLRSGRIFLVGLVFAGALVLVYLMRHRVAKLLTFLSTLGYAYLFLAIYRCISADMVFSGADHYATLPTAKETVSTPTARRVVWVIFDEMDYELSLGPRADAAAHLPHLAHLAAQGVSATDAYSPGRDTLFSIPALLMGTPVSGVAISSQNRFNLRDQHGRKLAFETQTSLFARLPEGPKSASVLGFYQPYCKMLTTLHACYSTYLGNAGRWFDSLTFFSEAVFSTLRHTGRSVQYMPEFLLYQFDPMYRASINTLSQLDTTLANPHSSLDFIHLNMPHLPNIYVQRLLRQPAGNERAAYMQNLAGVDLVLARIVRGLEAEAKHQDILLIVSSDHWLRTRTSIPSNVPFIAWKVGATAGQIVPQPFSTVHSASLALDFLSGAIKSQSDVAERMSRSVFYKTWIPPDDYKY